MTGVFRKDYFVRSKEAQPNKVWFRRSGFIGRPSYQ